MKTALLSSSSSLRPRLQLLGNRWRQAEQPPSLVTKRCGSGVVAPSSTSTSSFSSPSFRPPRWRGPPGTSLPILLFALLFAAVSFFGVSDVVVPASAGQPSPGYNGSISSHSSGSCHFDSSSRGGRLQRHQRHRQDDHLQSLQRQRRR